jgi:hypothetical protein
MLRRRSSLFSPMTNELTPMAIQEIKATIQDFQKIQQILEENHMIMTSPDALDDLYAQPLTSNKFVSQAHDLMEKASLLLEQAENMLRKAL